MLASVVLYCCAMLLCYVDCRTKRVAAIPNRINVPFDWVDRNRVRVAAAAAAANDLVDDHVWKLYFALILYGT